ncbi:MAG: hypothetical protein IIY70_03915 [Oscillospiraceae bacterium]|nr:hypothetical protein [Oscillospiraceae bacterium]
MKYFYGTDIEGNIEDDGYRYAKEIVPDSMQKDLGQKEVALAKAMRKATMPLWLEVVQIVCFCYGLVFLGLFIKFGSSAIQNPVFSWLPAISLLFSILLEMLKQHRIKHIHEIEPVRQAERSLQAAQRNVLSYLGVPDNAETMDILFFDYRIEDGEMELEEPAGMVRMRFSLRGDTLYMTNEEMLFALPREQFTALRRIDCSVEFIHLEDKTKLDFKKYKEAGVKMDKYGLMKLDSYCALEWTDRGETWQLLFPSYELPKMQALTGLQVSM